MLAFDLDTFISISGVLAGASGAAALAFFARRLSRASERTQVRLLQELSDRPLRISTESRPKQSTAAEEAEPDLPTTVPAIPTVAIEQYRRVRRSLLHSNEKRTELMARVGELEAQIESDEQRYRLLRSYAAQGLTQSKISFMVSLSAAGVGFVIIMVGVVTALTGADWTQAAIPVVSGTVIDAVALLFFSQDRRHQSTMFDFFERLREDRKLDEALALLRTTPDDEIKARIQAALVLHFADLPNPLEVLRVADRRSGEDKAATTDPT